MRHGFRGSCRCETLARRRFAPAVSPLDAAARSQVSEEIVYYCACSSTCGHYCCICSDHDGKMNAWRSWRMKCWRCNIGTFRVRPDVPSRDHHFRSAAAAATARFASAAVVQYCELCERVLLSLRFTYLMSSTASRRTGVCLTLECVVCLGASQAIQQTWSRGACAQVPCVRTWSAAKILALPQSYRPIVKFSSDNVLRS